jgi:hypothetical protein
LDLPSFLFAIDVYLVVVCGRKKKNECESLSSGAGQALQRKSKMTKATKHTTNNHQQTTKSKQQIPLLFISAIHQDGHRG